MAYKTNNYCEIYEISLIIDGKLLSDDHRAKITERMQENHPMFGKFHTVESKIKNSESNKRNYLPVEEGGKGYVHPMSGVIKGPLPEVTKRKLSEANSGENNPFFSKHHTEDAKK